MCVLKRETNQISFGISSPNEKNDYFLFGLLCVDRARSPIFSSFFNKFVCLSKHKQSFCGMIRYVSMIYFYEKKEILLLVKQNNEREFEQKSTRKVPGIHNGVLHLRRNLSHKMS